MPRIKFRPFSQFPEKLFPIFWSHVLVREPHECWPWLSSESMAGYGQFGVNGIPWFAHRIAYFNQYRRDPQELEVCHACDNPPCCNPNHLFLGTHSDNMRDCVRKGRLRPGQTQRGSRHHLAKLNDEKVKELRELYIQGSTPKELTQRFSIDVTNVWYILKRKTWKHVI